MTILLYGTLQYSWYIMTWKDSHRKGASRLVRKVQNVDLRREPLRKKRSMTLRAPVDFGVLDTPVKARFTQSPNPRAEASTLPRYPAFQPIQKARKMDITNFVISKRNDALLIGDYGSYRTALSRRILTLRRKLGRTSPKGKKYAAKAPITAEDIKSNHE